MKYFLIFIMLCLLTACSVGDRYDKHIVFDCIRKETLILKHNGGDTYFIEQSDINISKLVCKDSIKEITNAP